MGLLKKIIAANLSLFVLASCGKKDNGNKNNSVPKQKNTSLFSVWESPAEDGGKYSVDLTKATLNDRSSAVKVFYANKHNQKLNCEGTIHLDGDLKFGIIRDIRLKFDYHIETSPEFKYSSECSRKVQGQFENKKYLMDNNNLFICPANDMKDCAEFN